MNVRYPLIAATMVCMALLTACGIYVLRGSGTIRSEERAVSDFRAVSFTGLGEVTIVQGEKEGLTIETDDNLLPHIVSAVSQGVLTINLGDRPWWPILRPTASIHYTIYVKSLQTLEFAGAGTIYAAELVAEVLTLNQSGTGSITIDQLRADDLTVTMGGTGSITLVGKVTSQTVELSGLGSYEAGDLESQRAAVNLGGAGTATVWVSENLDAELAGIGTIAYYGASHTSISSSGLGTVTSLGTK